jgi:hypothetical protein
VKHYAALTSRVGARKPSLYPAMQVDQSFDTRGSFA